MGKRPGPERQLDKFILNVLKGQTELVSRPQLAKLLDKPKLVAYDFKVLQQMEADGMIEVVREKAGPVRVEYYYRAR
jgi:hypothetical protein